jgi:hypothetical protein
MAKIRKSWEFSNRRVKKNGKNSRIEWANPLFLVYLDHLQNPMCRFRKNIKNTFRNLNNRYHPCPLPLFIAVFVMTNTGVFW